MGPRRFKRQVIVVTLLLVTVICLMHSFEYEDAKVATNTPLLLKYIYRPSGKGGGKIQTLIFPGLTPLTKAVWHIPSSWLGNATTKPESIVEAAKLASGKAQAPQRQIPLSNIPMIVHQTWKNTDPQTWPQSTRQSTEKWLQAVEEGEMAYFLWDDEGIKQFIKHFEPGLEKQFYSLASNVERTDVFRVLVSKWIGGVVRNLTLFLVRLGILINVSVRRYGHRATPQARGLDKRLGHPALARPGNRRGVQVHQTCSRNHRPGG
jgi:hypothetical protein